MRLVYLGPFGFHPNKTMRSRALPLARALVQKGHSVRMIMPPWQTPAEAGRVWVEDGVELVYVSLAGGIVPTVGRMIQQAAQFQPETIHLFKPKAYAGLAQYWLWQTARRKYKLVLDMDDWEGWGGWNEVGEYTAVQKRFFAWQEQWGLRHAHALTLASRALESIVWAHGVPPAQTHYLPNGSGLEHYLDTPQRSENIQQIRQRLGLGNRPTLLLYSRLFEFAPQKLVAILQAVRHAVPEMVVLAVGAGLKEEDTAVLRHLLQQNNLLNSFVDVGWVEEAELPQLLATADVGLYLMEDNLLNRTKCPVKLADMLACGVPVVGERVGQVAEYIRHDETGLLYGVGDVAGLAGGVVRLLQNRGEANEMGRTAVVDSRQRFGWAHLTHTALASYTT
jgi:glycosyltransferase involved in cell wall biosynthesis